MSFILIAIQYAFIKEIKTDLKIFNFSPEIQQIFHEVIYDLNTVEGN
jgi:hypothetical protein